MLVRQDFHDFMTWGPEEVSIMGIATHKMRGFSLLIIPFHSLFQSFFTFSFSLFNNALEEKKEDAFIVKQRGIKWKVKHARVYRWWNCKEWESNER